MELGHFQILIGAVLLVAAGVAAIVVDSLRKHNERLRELTVELQLQRQHEDIPEVPARPAVAPKAAKNAIQQPASPKVSEQEPTLLDDELNESDEPELLRTDTLSAELDAELGQKRAISSGAMAAIQKGLKRAAERGKSPEASATEDSGPVTKEVIQKLRKQRAAIIAAEYGAPEQEAAHTPSRIFNDDETIDPLAELEVPAPKGVNPSHAVAVPADPERDWGALLSTVTQSTPKPAMADLVDVPRAAFVAAVPEEAKPVTRTTPVVTFEPTFGFFTDASLPPRQTAIVDPQPVSVVSATQAELPEALPQARPIARPVRQEPPTLPSGFQDGYVLSQLVLKKQPVSGLVVSIGATLPSSGPSDTAGETIQQRLRTLIQSLLGAHDFGAQSAEDEYLLVYPGERGASAQKRLSAIAERLWDFQLHSMGAFTIQFSWGGVEVRSESLDEAIASATERMEETRRSRRIAADVAALRRAS